MKLKTAVFVITCFLIILSNNLFSSPQASVVEPNGFLRVEGNKIVNSKGDPIVLRGMSLFWSQWMGQFYNPSCINWLKEDWQCTVVRAAMGIEHGGYLDNPDVEKSKIKNVINSCIDEGIYVIVDWHDHNAHRHTEKSIEFFKEIATEYKDYPNIIYEIYNEPLQISWADSIKPYCEKVIEEIRKIDTKNLILVGNPTWSQDVDVAANDPIDANNLAYVLHFYAATHKQSLRNKAKIALNKGIALFVSEFGTVEATGDGPINYDEVEAWMNFMEENKISWCNWSVADKDETSAALKPGVNPFGSWADSELTESGKLIRNKIISSNNITSVKSFQENNNEGLDLHTYPNPFNNQLNIKFVNKKYGRVKINLFNSLGQNVGTLMDKNCEEGEHKFNFDFNDFSSGNYFLFCQTEEKKDVVKLQLLK